jgi:hypothetical protein
MQVTRKCAAAWAMASFCSTTNSTRISSADANPQSIYSRCRQQETESINEKGNQRECRSLARWPIDRAAIVSDTSHLIHMKAILMVRPCIPKEDRQTYSQKNQTGEAEDFSRRAHIAVKIRQLDTPGKAATDCSWMNALAVPEGSYAVKLLIFRSQRL